MMTKGRQRPGLGWVYRNALARSRSLVSLFLFLFALAMPIALLIVGKDNYIAQTTPSIYGSADFGPSLNEMLLPLHIVLGLLSLAFVFVLGGSHFSYLYRQNAVDREMSFPFNRHEAFLGKALAFLTGITAVFAINLAVTGAILYGWDLWQDFTAYLPLYLRLLLATLEFSSFSLLLLTLAGTLFDAVLLNIAIQGTWIVSTLQILGLVDRLQDRPTDLIWLLAPAAHLFTAIIWPLSIVQTLAMIVFWSVGAWLLFRRRPAEHAAVRSGRLDWFLLVQPLFSMFGAITLGQFFFLLFDWSFPQNTAFRSGFFYIGLLIGALLGQFVSAVVMGKPFKRRLIHRELLLALLGIALFFVITGLVAVFIPLSQ